MSRKRKDTPTADLLAETEQILGVTIPLDTRIEEIVCWLEAKGEDLISELEREAAK